MTDFTFATGEPKTDNEYRAAIDLCIDEMKRLRGKMDSDQNEIDRLSREAQELKEQISKIKAQTQARLEALDKMVPAIC